MKTVVIDAGHGGSDSGATYQGYQEKTFNLSIALNVQRFLTQNYQVNILMTRTNDVTLSLNARTRLANRENADFFLSIHNNAAGGSGFETYIYNGALNPNTRTYQNIIHNSTYRAIGGKYNVRDRGKKRANLYVTRETDMSALLIEVLFIDNPGDLALLRNSTFINDVSRGIAEGVADSLDLPRKPQPSPPPSEGDALYRVIAGSFRNRKNAEDRIESLARQGFPGFVVPTTISGTQYYRVQTGAFAKEENAKEQVEQLKRIGITNAFIVRGEDSSPQPEPENPEDGLFRVIAGSFRNRENAEQRIKDLSKEGIDGFIVQADISGVTHYRVQTGAYSEKENAEAQVERLKSIGISDAFILGEDSTPPSEPDPEPDPEPEPPEEDGYSILGDMYLSPCQLDDFVKTVNPDAPDLGRFYIQYGEAYEIRGDIAYAQAIHETDYFRFTGLVDEDQNNFAGIGATGPGNPGATFDTPEEGVHAHIQHLYAYASTDPIPSELEKVDPRFDLVTRGIAPTWTELNGRWAVPGETYGQLILQIYERNINHAIEEISTQREQLNDVLEEL
ncbi:N-acetylmuramoyl-L-alanine amidase [Halobacillus karajensis]|uniref:N-acetylmuramoyl-L-alanine amidase n=1 Tax=Halobacillus karajensis TaxID=195088 RepID=UPI0008A72D5B|nr:N-acetylmuramoyl-L-alanine amidase [Halobacillus karajensis]SEH83313.1 N-acetylmuramoyl-L-alanine amidase [Halobacillus karajensis]